MTAEFQLTNEIRRRKHSDISNQFTSIDEFTPKKDKNGDYIINYEWLTKQNLLLEWSNYVMQPINEDFQQIISKEKAQSLGIIS